MKRKTKDKVISCKEPINVDTDMLANKLGVSRSKVVQIAVARLWVDEISDEQECA